MRSNYKKLGKYIELVNERNKDLQVDRLLGVSIQKVLMPSIANTVGTDMSRYKIIRKKQFAYGPVTSRNGDKISVALLLDFENAIISQAYTVFEINDHEDLDPEYLMMWFRRPEFDRYGRFKSHGSARETFDWDEMCDVELPIPSIEKQRAIVKEYNTVVNRIQLNEKLNQKLEATAQALYRHWFVDFEFPNENGQPYKSSGGKMVWNEELEKEIPEGWEYDELGKFTTISAGGDKPKIYSLTPIPSCDIPIYSNTSKNGGLFGFTSEPKILKNSITISARGAIIGFTRLRLEPFFPIVRLIVVTPNENFQLNYIFNCIKKFKYNDLSSAQGQLTVPEISSFKIIYPEAKILKQYQKLNSTFSKQIVINRESIQKLEELKSVFLSKMTKAQLQVAIP